MKVKRLIALLIGLALVGILFFAYCEWCGNPFVKIIAKHKMIDYLETHFKDETYETSGVSFNFKDNSYMLKVDVENSEDGDFTVGYKNGEVWDDYDWRVIERNNTGTRLQIYLNKEDREDILKDIFGDQFDWAIMLVDEQAWEKDLPELDMSIEDMLAKYPIHLSIYLKEGSKVDDIEKIKEEITERYLQTGIKLSLIEFNTVTK